MSKTINFYKLKDIYIYLNKERNMPRHKNSMYINIYFWQKRLRQENNAINNFKNL